MLNEGEHGEESQGQEGPVAEGTLESRADNFGNEAKVLLIIAGDLRRLQEKPDASKEETTTVIEGAIKALDEHIEVTKMWVQKTMESLLPGEDPEAIRQIIKDATGSTDDSGSGHVIS